MLKNVPWDSSYVYENIDDIWSHWSSLFKQVLVEHSSVKRVQLRNNQLPWIRPDIQKQIRIRNRFYKKFIRASTTLNWANYKKKRTKAVKDFCIDATSRISFPGEFWKKLKPLLPNNKFKADGANNIHLLDEGKLISNPSTAVNDFFVSPRTQESALSLTEDDFDNHPSITTIRSNWCQLDFAFMEITTETVTE